MQHYRRKHFQPALHADRRVMAEPCRTVLCRDYLKAHPPRQLHQRRRTGGHYLRLPDAAQRQAQAIHLEQDRQRHPHPSLLGLNLTQVTICYWFCKSTYCGEHSVCHNILKLCGSVTTCPECIWDRTLMGEENIEIYRQRYETFRHFDKLRWQMLQILVAVASATALLLRSTTDPIEWWFFCLLGAAFHHRVCNDQDWEWHSGQYPRFEKGR